jgi:hypothetical protein
MMVLLKKIRLWQAFALAMLMWSTIGCGPTPEKIGDECDPEGDPCPKGSVCAPGGEDHICQIPPGGTCTPGAADLCQGNAVCAPDGKCALPLGDPCNQAGPDYCIGDAVCVSTSTCEIPQDGACDPAGADHCEGDLVCGDNHDGTGTCGLAEGTTCDPADDKCAGGLSCAELQAGGYACYPPVLIKGMVFDSQTSTGIPDAQVLALDDQATAVSDIAVTDADGNYVLEVPVQRLADGAPIPDVNFTLRASASGYQTFPGGLRTALPLSSTETMSEVDGWNLKSAITDIALIALPMDQQGRPSIAGTVLADAQSGGVLVVAEDGASAGHSAVTDRKGAYTIFNVPDGSYTVRGYAAGLQLTPAMTTVAGMPVTGVDLALSTDGLGTVSGSVTIVNPGMGTATSVVLVVASTFSDTFVRGEVPRGLRTPLTGPPNITGNFTITDVPAGEYIVLAAFENDFLVRDPDPNIAGTQIVTVTMPSPGQAVPLPTSFKITGALPIVGPGADRPEAVMATTPPTLEWGDDASEDFYTVTVYNAYGDLVWCLSSEMMNCDGPNIPAVSGSATVTVPYGGPLEPGMYYQFRATAWRSPGGTPGPISNTEDLRGVFYVGTAP